MEGLVYFTSLISFIMGVSMTLYLTGHHKNEIQILGETLEIIRDECHTLSDCRVMAERALGMIDE